MFTNKTKQNKNLATLFKSVNQGHENQGNQGQTEIVGTQWLNGCGAPDGLLEPKKDISGKQGTSE